MYGKTPQASKACGVSSWWGEVVVLGLCVEAGLVALAALLADALEHGASCHSAHDGTDDRASRAGAVKATGGSEAPGDDDAYQPVRAQCPAGAHLGVHENTAKSGCSETAAGSRYVVGGLTTTPHLPAITPGKKIIMSERRLALCLPAAIPVAVMQPANAASVESQTASYPQAASSVNPSAPSEDIHDQLDSELKYLSDLPVLELDKELQPLEYDDGTRFRRTFAQPVDSIAIVSRMP